MTLLCLIGILWFGEVSSLSRAVNSTLAAEAQSMAVATGTVEWLSLIVSELLEGPFDLRSCRNVMQERPPIVITDCKSLYDHLNSPSQVPLQ